MFTLFADGHRPATYPTKDAALSAARDLHVDAWEVYDEQNDRSVHVEYPKARWV